MWHVYYKSHIISVWIAKNAYNIYVEQGKQTLLSKKEIFNINDLCAN